MRMRLFGRVYYAVAAVTLAAAVCIVWLDTLSMRVLGFDPRLASAGTHEAFQMRMAASSLKSEFLSGALLLALCLVALSIAALVLRARRRTDIRWPIIALTTVGAVAVAVFSLAGLVMQGGGMCC